jgi:hypothetical protein
MTVTQKNHLLKPFQSPFLPRSTKATRKGNSSEAAGPPTSPASICGKFAKRHKKIASPMNTQFNLVLTWTLALLMCIGISPVAAVPVGNALLADIAITDRPHFEQNCESSDIFVPHLRQNISAPALRRIRQCYSPAGTRTRLRM